MASALPRIEGIALVGSRNQKLYLTSRISTTSQQSADDATAARLRNDMLRLEYAAHSALDVVEERSKWSIERVNMELIFPQQHRQEVLVANSSLPVCRIWAWFSHSKICLCSP